MNESVYCFNCDNEAVVYVDWRYSGSPESETHRSFMCRTCADAFQFGQITPEVINNIDLLND
jgi:hypothetical protein